MTQLTNHVHPSQVRRAFNYVAITGLCFTAAFTTVALFNRAYILASALLVAVLFFVYALNYDLEEDASRSTARD